MNRLLLIYSFTHVLNSPALDGDDVLIEVIKEADPEVNAGFSHPHGDGDSHSSHVDRYLLKATCLLSIKYFPKINVL